jgi:anti-anti-sigma factor
MSSYAIETRDGGDGNEVHLALSGELDLTNASDLARRLDEAPEAERLVVDLNEISFLDSAALHVLFTLLRRRGPDRVMFVADPGAHVASTLAIVALPHVPSSAAR